MAHSTELEVKYNDETYSLLEVPKSTSQIVVEAKDRMVQVINLPQLAKDFSNLGKFLRLAFSGVVGYIDLQTRVRKIFYDVVRMCDESVHTMNEFQRASHTAIESLQAIYEFLVDGMDDLAITNLEEIAGNAGKMAKAAAKLSKDFRTEAEAVQKLEEETSQEESKSKERSKKYELEQKAAKVDRERQKAVIDDIIEEETKAEKEYNEARKKEMDEIQYQKFGFFKSFGNILTGKVLGKGVYDGQNKVADLAAKVHEQDKEKFYQEMVKARVQRRVALEQMAIFVKKMEQLGEESMLEAAAAESLHHAATALVNLSDIMSNTSRFWEETENLCQELSSPKMTKIIKGVANLDDDKRKKVFDNHSFKMSGIRYYGSWIAINNICEAYRGSVMDAQREVHAYIRDNPNEAEAREIIKELAPELQEIIKKDLQALKDSRHLAIKAS